LDDGAGNCCDPTWHIDKRSGRRTIQMALSPALAAQLAALTASIDEPELDLGDQLDVFATAVRAAVPSYRGMRLTVRMPGQPITFTHRDSDSTNDIQTSVLVPLTETESTAEETTLVLWAAKPGAFVDLAADISHLLGVPLARLELDAHHTPSIVKVGGIDGIEDLAVINQAIGVLIARGATPESAAAELTRERSAKQYIGAARTVVRRAGNV
jgi:hypothetical protein